MKKIIFTILILLAPSIAFAQFAPINTNQGGTGLSSYTKGDIIYASTTNAIRLTKLPIGADGTCLGVTSGLPAYIACGGGSLSGGIANALTYWINGTTVGATTTPTVSAIIATSTIATSTFAGGFGIGTTSPFGTVSIEQGTEANSFWVGNNGSSSPSFTIGGTDRGGKIGIGTASPLAQLHIVSPVASVGALILENPGTDVTMQLRKAATIKAELGVNSGDQIYLRRSNSGTAPFIINTSNQALFTVGNVGIGTTSPYAALSVAGSTGVVANMFTATSTTASSTIASAVGIGITKPLVKLHVANSQVGRNTIGDARVMMLENTNGATSELQEIGFGYAFNAAYQPVVIGHKVTDGTGSTKGSFYIATRDSGTSSINPTERLTIDSAGDMGIGTSTPIAKLAVSANASDAYNQYIIMVASSTSGTATSSLLAMKSNGFIGLNTISPNAPLEINGASNGEALRVTRQNSPGQYMAINEADGSAHRIQAIGDKPFRISLTGAVGNNIEFYANNPSALVSVMTSLGNFGLGTSSPYGKLTVVASSTTVPIIAAYGFNNQTAPLMLVASTSGTSTSTAMLIDSQGRMGLGTTTPSQMLDVNGGIKLDTSIIKPTCNATVRGTFWFTRNGAGVKDNAEVCAKDATDTYAWRTIY